MTNNDILRRLRYAFDFSNPQACKLFELDPNNSQTVSTEQFLALLAKDDADNYVECSDALLSTFLDGLIVSKRGLKEPNPDKPAAATDDKPKPEIRLSKNDILKKLRIAMNFREQEMLDTLAAGGATISKGELGALFRKPQHKHYRQCGNQVLRNFIKGLTIQFRPEDVKKSDDEQI